jgi:ABC-type multidrug transport system ATPase subunit
MPESDGHIPGMNAVTFVAYAGQLAGLPKSDAMQRAHECLFYVGLGEARYRNIETYSTGMKQRIKLAQALVHDPDLLFLDEPTNGMDPKGRDEMLELIRDIAHNKGINLILSSHLLPDVEYTCDYVVVLDKGTVATHGPIDALKGVTAKFARGAVGLLGPNGAGKSTMLKALLGFVKPSVGRMTVLGLDVASSPLEIRSRIGYMPESDAHIPGMNAVSFVGYCGQLAGLPPVDAMQRAHEVLYYVGLGEARYRNVETYSTGMKQRIKLAQALVHDPDLLFLDEPTNGMDPKGREEMLDLIRDLGHNKNVNLILSSHLLPDVEYTCDHVIVKVLTRIRLGECCPC